MDLTETITANLPTGSSTKLSSRHFHLSWSLLSWRNIIVFHWNELKCFCFIVGLRLANLYPVSGYLFSSYIHMNDLCQFCFVDNKIGNRLLVASKCILQINQLLGVLYTGKQSLIPEIIWLIRNIFLIFCL